MRPEFLPKATPLPIRAILLAIAVGLSAAFLLGMIWGRLNYGY